MLRLYFFSIVIKAILWVVCIVNKSAQSKALKKDHQIDIPINISALILSYLGK